jgi:copper homeostasis protein
MLDAIGAARAAGADGIVVGALTAGGEVDAAAMRRLLAASRPLAVTFHRAFDAVADQAAALGVLVSLGVDRVLTSGGAVTALAGADRLCNLVDLAEGRIVILAGGGIRPDNVAEVVRRSGVTEVHARMDDDPRRAQRLREAVNESWEPRAESGRSV